MGKKRKSIKPKVLLKDSSIIIRVGKLTFQTQ